MEYEEFKEAEAKYFPFEKGFYDLTPGLRPLGFDFGNGNLDKKIFQIDNGFHLFRENKIQCVRERLSKYMQTHNFSYEMQRVLVRFIVEKLLYEYPEFFYFDWASFEFVCMHTGDVIKFQSNWELKEFMTKSSIQRENKNDLVSALLLLSLQVSEDLALISRIGDESNWLSFLHISSPSHWSPEDKIGKDFFLVHLPIPGIDKLNQISSKIVDAMIMKGPYVRFVWSFVTDQRLNHHPEAPLNEDPRLWHGRTFDKNLYNPFYIRVERQVIYGIPEIQSSLFTIKISFISAREIRENLLLRENLISTLKSMSLASRVYKGIDRCFEDIINWLNKTE